MIAFVVLVSVFMFLVYRKRMSENFGPVHTMAVRRGGTLRTPQYYRNPFSPNPTRRIPYTPQPYGPGIPRGQPLGPDKFSLFNKTVNDIRPSQGVIVQGLTPSPSNIISGVNPGFPGGPGMYSGLYSTRQGPYVRLSS